MCIYIIFINPGLSVHQGTMEVTLPQKTMSDSDIMKYVSILSIQNFRGVLMRDELPFKPNAILAVCECLGSKFRIQCY